MNCEQVREGAYAFHKGWLEEADASVLRAHLDSCPACSAELASLPRCLSSLSGIEEIEPSPRVWDGVRERLGRARRAAPVPMKLVLSVAAAASVLVAALSFVLITFAAPKIVATVAYQIPRDKSVLRPGHVIHVGGTLQTTTYTVLTLPGVGTLRLDRETAVEFASARRVVLHAGQLFAEVEPGGEGFVVESCDAEIAVEGTRFGVIAAGGTLVYVLEGSVEFSSSGARRRVGANQVAVSEKYPVSADSGAAPEERIGELAGWMSSYEKPALRVSVKAERPAWEAVLCTDSPAPVWLGDFRGGASQVYARIRPPKGTSYTVRLEKEAVEIKSADGGPGGSLRLDLSRPVKLSVKLEPGLFRGGPGRYHVSIGYLSAPELEQGPPYWRGMAESPPLPWEVSR